MRAQSPSENSPQPSQEAPAESPGSMPPPGDSEASSSQVENSHPEAAKALDPSKAKTPTGDGQKLDTNDNAKDNSNPVPTLAEDSRSDAKGLQVRSGVLDLPEDYKYDPTAGRDPFRPFRVFIEKKVQCANPPCKESTKEAPVILDPLQMIDIDKLKIIGIIWDVKTPRAMIAEGANSGKYYMIQVGSKVGRNGGVVRAIREGEVIIVETEEVEGTVTRTTKILELGK